MNSDDLNARRARLERTHADISKRLSTAAAELDRLSTADPTPETVTGYVEAQRTHLDLATALSNTERLLHETDAAIERAAADERRTEQLQELLEVISLIEANREAFSDRLERIATLLKPELSACLEHKSTAFRLLMQLDPLVYALAPGFRSHRSYFDVDREEQGRADQFAEWLKEQHGADLKRAFEGSEQYPEAFADSLTGLINQYSRVRDLETRREEEGAA